jgi:alpha-galactosidase
MCKLRTILMLLIAVAWVAASRLPVAIAEEELPGSFVYGGKSSKTLLPSWQRSNAVSTSPEGRRIDETSWCEPDGGLVATWRVVQIAKEAVEYRWVFENKGTKPTKALTDVAALDLSIAGASQTELVSSTGGLTGPVDGTPPGFIVATASLAGPVTLSAAEGRSSNKNLPFWVLHNKTSNGGRYFGVGWSGQWAANIRPIAGEDAARVTVGMPGMNIALPPGERIVSPSVLVGDYQGNSQAGCNALRRVLHGEYVANLGDKKLLPPVSWNSWFTFNNNISDAMLRAQADAAADLGLEYFCIDAGWFVGAFDAGVGNWTADRAKFPQGLRPIGEYVRQKGIKLGLWFEPGRAMPGSRLAVEHPEWVYRNQVKLEIPAARDWLFDAMSTAIDEAGAAWIRYDMNQGYFKPDPLTAWSERDTAETQGLTQIRYLLGEYDLFDRLRSKYPNMAIESCASGGRRIDLETIRRAHTFWKSDETNNLVIARSQETGANYFLPGGLLNTNLPGASAATTFDLHSLFAGPLGFATNWTTLDAAGRDRVRRAIADYKSIRHLLAKDYYPLFPQTFDEKQWIGWEFFDAEAGEGFLVVLRPKQSAVASSVVRLQGVEPDKSYELNFLDGSDARTVAGSELSAGMELTLDPAGSKVVRFRSKK